MQHRMLAVAALASLGIAGPAAIAAGATLGTVFGGVGSQSYPVVIELSKTGKKVVRATTAFSLKCQLPDKSLLTPDSWKNLSIDGAGKFSARYGPVEEPVDPASGASKYIVSGFITGKVKKLKTSITGTWGLKIIVISAADPTGATVLDTCDSGTMSYTAKN